MNVVTAFHSGLRWLAAGAACAALGLGAGCGTPPVTRLHSLLSTTAPAPSAATAVRPASTPALVIDLAQVSVPAAVDQPQWLVREPDDSLRLLEQERWASSPREELHAALAERLTQAFGALDSRAMVPGQPVASTTVWRVRVDVLRFESMPGREAWLEAAWSLLPSTAAPRAATSLSCRSSLREAATGDLAALAPAHRRAVVRLADQIGARLAALNRGQSAACGTPDGP